METLLSFPFLLSHKYKLLSYQTNLQKTNQISSRYFRITWTLGNFFWETGRYMLNAIDRTQPNTLHGTFLIQEFAYTLPFFFFSNSHIFLNKWFFKCCQYTWRCQSNLDRDVKDCLNLRKATVKNKKVSRKVWEVLVRFTVNLNCFQCQT